MNDFYVYVYIDPRNFEEFYYGKGKGSRKYSHLHDEKDSEKTRRINKIKKEGLTPIVRVISRNLSEHDAFLVEKTLLWKLGKHLTNISSGHYADNFRPHDTLHKDLSGFDYQNALFYYNVGEGIHRNWDDYREFGFISAGQGDRFRKSILGLEKGDLIAAYLKRKGFVGIAKILQPARPVREVLIKQKPFLTLPLRCKNMADNSENDEKSEHVAVVDWLVSVSREDARWVSNEGLYTTTHVIASLDGQPKTISFLEKEFDICFSDFIK